MNSLVAFLDGRLSEFQAIVEAMPDAMVLVHRTQGVQYWRPGAADRDSISEDDLAKVNPAFWATSEQRVDMQRMIDACLDTQSPQHTELELVDRVMTPATASSACCPRGKKPW